MPPPCALARSKLHALPALPPPAAGVLRTAEDRFEALPGYRYAPKYADVADAEKVRGAVWRMTSVSTTTHEMQAGLKNESACRGAGGAAFGGTDLRLCSRFPPSGARGPLDSRRQRDWSVRTRTSAMKSAMRGARSGLRGERPGAAGPCRSFDT